MMKCPYCDNEMEEGALRSRVVPEWVKKGEKKGHIVAFGSTSEHLEFVGKGIYLNSKLGSDIACADIVFEYY